MDELIEFYGKPQAIRKDNGPEMATAKFVSWAERQGIAMRFMQPGKPNQNAFVERFNRSVRQEVLNAWPFDSLAQAQQILESWRIECNTVRSHESLGKKTPQGYLPRVISTNISNFNLSI
jgi:putative transposase